MSSFELEWQEDTHGHAEPTLVFQGRGEGEDRDEFESAVIEAHRHCEAVLNVTPTRLDLAGLGRPEDLFSPRPTVDLSTVKRYMTMEVVV